MYEDNGIIYVVGMEEEFMGFFLKYYRKRYKYQENLEKPTAQQRQRAKELAQMNKNKREETYRMYLLEERRRKEQEQERLSEVKITREAEELAKQKQKEYHAAWYQDNKERIDSKRTSKAHVYTKQNIPYSSDSIEYAREYRRLNRDKQNYQAREWYRKYKAEHPEKFCKTEEQREAYRRWRRRDYELHKDDPVRKERHNAYQRAYRQRLKAEKQKQNATN